VKILIVEDHDLSAALFRDLLEVAGHQVRHAGTAAQAFQLIGEQLPDLILMDIGLPDMDGLEAVRRLRRMPEASDVCIVCLTAHAMVGTARQAHAEGCEGCLFKPIDTRSFARELDEILLRRQERRGRTE
jgi:two-component system cell cycle response regulator DivK